MLLFSLVSQTLYTAGESLVHFLYTTRNNYPQILGGVNWLAVYISGCYEPQVVLQLNIVAIERRYDIEGAITRL